MENNKIKIHDNKKTKAIDSQDSCVLTTMPTPTPGQPHSSNTTILLLEIRGEYLNKH